MASALMAAGMALTAQRCSVLCPRAQCHHTSMVGSSTPHLFSNAALPQPLVISHAVEEEELCRLCPKVEIKGLIQMEQGEIVMCRRVPW